MYELNFTPEQDEQLIINCFHNERYFYLNDLRWDVILKTGIELKDRVILEVGAGIGDQTQWLLDQGAEHVVVSDGRESNLDIIRKRFGELDRISFLHGDLEKCGEWMDLRVDMVFCIGVYYHVEDSLESFHVLRNLRRFGDLIILEYLESPEDLITGYGYDNPSTSLSQQGIRPTATTMINGMKKAWEHVYFPAVQIDWDDPYAPGTPRRIIIGSTEPLEGNLIEQ